MSRLTARTAAEEKKKKLLKLKLQASRLSTDVVFFLYCGFRFGCIRDQTSNAIKGKKDVYDVPRRRLVPTHGCCAPSGVRRNPLYTSTGASVADR